jgi:uncharacterized protein YutE (UPF0331/DUF86 family)
MPQASGDAFSLLESGGLLSDELARSLRAMTGFRNIAIHQYQDLDKEIVPENSEDRDFDLACLSLFMINY